MEDAYRAFAAGDKARPGAIDATSFVSVIFYRAVGLHGRSKRYGVRPFANRDAESPSCSVCRSSVLGCARAPLTMVPRDLEYCQGSVGL